MHNRTCPNNGVKTFRETRLAVGRLRDKAGYAPVQPTMERSAVNIPKIEWSGLLKIAIGRTRKISMNRNFLVVRPRHLIQESENYTWKSPKLEADA